VRFWHPTAAVIAGKQMMNRREFTLLVSSVSLGFCSAARASDETSIHIDGDIGTPGGVVLGDAELTNLTQTAFDTATPWTDAPQHFSGPLLSTLLQQVGAGPGNIKVTSFNNYVVEIERSLITETAPILAARINERPFGIRNKGPYWIVFPYDDSVNYQSETIYAASVWQVKSITVLKA
jgi:hypothetical protein